MVKGISRQVILVKAPDPELFEQAIFILRSDALGKEGVSDRAILRQAQEAAGSYAAADPLPRRKSALLGALAGAAGTGLVWLLTALI